MGMEKSLADEILRLKRLLAEEESLNRVLHSRLEEREREIERLLAQLDKLRRMYFGCQSEKLARRIAGHVSQGGVKIQLPLFGSVMRLLCAPWQRFYHLIRDPVYLGHALLRQVTVLQEPLLVLLRQHRA